MRLLMAALLAFALGCARAQKPAPTAAARANPPKGNAREMMQACYNKERERDPSLCGTIRVHLRFGKDGVVDDVAIIRNDAGPALEHCLVEAWLGEPSPFHEWSFETTFVFDDQDLRIWVPDAPPPHCGQR
jgi:hypothetical protein